jgi:hypothetical protein
MEFGLYNGWLGEAKEIVKSTSAGIFVYWWRRHADVHYSLFLLLIGDLINYCVAFWTRGNALLYEDLHLISLSFTLEPNYGHVMCRCSWHNIWYFLLVSHIFLLKIILFETLSYILNVDTKFDTYMLKGRFIQRLSLACKYYSLKVTFVIFIQRLCSCYMRAAANGNSISTNMEKYNWWVNFGRLLNEGSKNDQFNEISI